MSVIYGVNSRYYFSLLNTLIYTPEELLVTRTIGKVVRVDSYDTLLVQSIARNSIMSAAFYLLFAR